MAADEVTPPRSSPSRPPLEGLHPRIRELELFRSKHEETLEGLPATLLHLQLGVERLSTTVRLVGTGAGLLLAAIEALHYLVR